MSGKCWSHKDLARKAAPQDDPLGAEFEVQRAVIDAVDALAEPYRTTIYLRYFESLSAKEIAGRLRIPEKTVKTRMTRGHEHLRLRLRKHFECSNGSWAPALLGFAGVSPTASASPLTLLAPALVMKKFALVLVVALSIFLGWRAWFSQVEPLDQVDDRTAEGLLPEATESKAPEVATLEQLDGGREAVSRTAPDQPVQVEREEQKYGALRVAVQWSDGGSAQQVHVVAREHDPGDLPERRFRCETDVAGIAFFEKLPPGTFFLGTDRGGQEEEVLIVLGQATEAEISLPRGVRVQGVVLDTQQRPVPQANIWLTSSTGGWTAGGIAATADGAGRFDLFDVPLGESIGALAVGFQPSALVDLDTLDTNTSPVLVELRLASGGGQLSGVIQNALGLPVEGALVAFGNCVRFDGIRADDSRIESWSPRVCRTDELGQFSLSALSLGTFDLHVRGLGYADWRGSVTLDHGQDAHQEILLSRPATVRGQVTNSEGEVVGGAKVCAFHQPLRESFLQSGQIDYEGAFAYLATKADEQGYYELEGLSPGEMFLYAIEPDQSRSSARENLRYTKQKHNLNADQAVTWNPVLSDGRVIEGLALFRDGSPIKNTFVSLSGNAAFGGRSYYTTDGSFRFLQLEASTYTVRVQMRERPRGTSEPILEGVIPDRGPIELIADFDSPSAFGATRVQVRFVDAAMRGDEATTVVLEELGKANHHFGKQAQAGLWNFELTHSGHYQPLAMSGDRVIAVGPSVEIHGGEDLDLGEFRSGPAAALLLKVLQPEGHPVSDLRVRLKGIGSARGELVELGADTEVLIQNLEPGRGALTTFSESSMPLKLDFELEAGEQATLELPLVASVPVSYQIEWGAEEVSGGVQVRFLDRLTSTAFYEFELESLAAFRNPIKWDTQFLLGSYTFEVQFDGGRKYSEDFEVESLERERAPHLKTGL